MINQLNQLLKNLIKVLTLVPEKQCNFETPKSTFLDTKDDEVRIEKDWAR